MTPLDAAWEAVLGAPDDDRALCVLADALMERGDPHGELIRLQLAGTDPSEHLARHAAELLRDPHRLRTWSPTFARGFISSVQVTSAAELEAVIARPVGKLLRKVDISPLTTEPISQIVDVLAARGPRTISCLWFGRGLLIPWAPAEANELDHLDVHHLGAVQVDELAKRLTSLEELMLGSWAGHFGSAPNASLRNLGLNLQHRVTESGHRGYFGAAHFPALHELSLQLPFSRRKLPLPLLAGEAAPQLRALTLTGGFLWPQQLSELSGSALLRGLATLRITVQAETGWYPTLLKTLDSFAHLHELELLADRHHPEWVAAVRAALPQAIIREPRLRL